MVRAFPFAQNNKNGLFIFKKMDWAIISFSVEFYFEFYFSEKESLNL
jgi:hypothetical protein